MAQAATIPVMDDAVDAIEVSRRRSKTRKPRRVTKKEREPLQYEYHWLESYRPDVWSECMGRPPTGEEGVCPFVGCRHHLALDVKPRNGHLTEVFPHVGLEKLDRLPANCALRVASKGEHTLEEVGEFMNLTRERVRQIEAVALEKMRRKLVGLGYEIDDIETVLRVP